MNLSHIQEIAFEQREKFLEKDAGTKRDIAFEHFKNSPQIVVVSGIRRSGKSTLLRQFAALYEEFHYINFDDERLIEFSVSDFSNLILAFQKRSDSKTIFIDEIQNVPSWERFARRINDEGYKLYITGSNAKLLSSELSTHLTGRHLKIELYPFSFKEVLKFKGLSYGNILTSEKKAEVLTCFDFFLENGGFPEYLKYNDSDFVKRTYDDVLFRDIISRFAIRDIKGIKNLSHYLFTNFCSEISYNSLKNVLGFKSPMSVRSHISFLEESYLLFELFKFDYSLKKQHVNNKKIYAIDNGMRNAVAFRFSGDSGRLLENLIFIELKRRGCQLYYHREKNECDFIIEEKNRPVEAIQVCYNLKDSFDRELRGIESAFSLLPVKTGTIITYSEEDEEEISGRKVKIIPAWKWLLS
jgi:predicted AAA+ superfamily ATPase